MTGQSSHHDSTTWTATLSTVNTCRSTQSPSSVHTHTPKHAYSDTYSENVFVNIRVTCVFTMVREASILLTSAVVVSHTSNNLPNSQERSDTASYDQQTARKADSPVLSLGDAPLVRDCKFTYCAHTCILISSRVWATRRSLSTV
jgi:hypothetical protein